MPAYPVTLCEAPWWFSPYLFFDGRCEEALDFHKSSLRAKVTRVMPYQDAPDPPPGMVLPGSEGKIMHASFRLGETTVMGSDGRCGGQLEFRGFSLSLTVASEGEADRVFAALAEGGHVHMPLGTTFFAPRFGMVAGRFGVSWMLIVTR